MTRLSRKSKLSDGSVAVTNIGVLQQLCLGNAMLVFDGGSNGTHRHKQDPDKGNVSAPVRCALFVRGLKVYLAPDPTPSLSNGVPGPSALYLASLWPSLAGLALAHTARPPPPFHHLACATVPDNAMQSSPLLQYKQSIHSLRRNHVDGKATAVDPLRVALRHPRATLGRRASLLVAGYAARLRFRATSPSHRNLEARVMRPRCGGLCCVYCVLRDVGE